LSDLIKVTAVFMIIVLLLRWKLGLGWVMLLSSLVTALLYRISPLRAIKISLETAVSYETISLVGALVLIAYLENVMRSNHLLDRMVMALKRLTGDSRPVMATLPALIGFLPSAGGAFFSAPLVEEVGEGLLSERKGFINYWYRHLWEYSFPLYPGLMLATQILQIPAQKLIISQFPLTISAALIGIPFAFRGIPNSIQAKPLTAVGTGNYLRDLIPGVGPILLVVALVLALGLDVAVAVGLVAIGLSIAFHYSPRRVWETLREAISASTVTLVLGIMIFKNMLAAAGVVISLSTFFKSLGISPVPLSLVLPFVTGFLTGYTPAFVGVAFPLLLGMMTGAGVDINLVRLAFAGGFAGVMLSPLHLCLVLTAHYFHTDPWKILRRVYLPEAAVVLLALAAYYIQ